MTCNKRIFFKGVNTSFPVLVYMFAYSFIQRDLVLCDMRRVGVQMRGTLRRGWMKSYTMSTHTHPTIAFVPRWMRWCHHSAFPCASYQVAYQHAWLLFSSALWKNDKTFVSKLLSCLQRQHYSSESERLYFSYSFFLSISLRCYATQFYQRQVKFSVWQSIYVPCEVVKHSKSVTYGPFTPRTITIQNYKNKALHTF